MSKKLLMAVKDDEYRGPVVYETLAGTDIQAKPTDENYKLLEDGPLYFMGFNGAIQINGNDLPIFLGEEVEPGIYEYRILQQSVTNPEKQSITRFRLNKQLVSWRSNWYDRMYWDDSEGCYMIEKNASFVRLDGSDSSNVVEASGAFASVEVGGYPNSCDDDIAPYVTSNWTVSTRTNAVNNGLTSIIGYAWTASNLSFFLPGRNLSSASDLMNIFTANPVNATFPAHNTVASGSLSDSGVSPAEGVITERTGLTKKIKLKQYSGGTIYSMMSASGSLKTTIRVDIPTMENKYMPYTQNLEGEGVTIASSAYYPTKVYFEGFDGKFTTEYSCTNSKSDEYKAIGPYYKAITLGERIDDDNFLFKIVARSADGSKSETVEFILPDMVCTYNDTFNDNNAVYPNCYVQWSDEHGCYVYYANSEYILLDNLDTFKYGSFRKAKVQEYRQWTERPAWRSPVMSHLEIMPLADPSTTSNYPNGYYVNADRTEPYYVGAYVQNPIITWSNYSTSSTSSSATEEDRKYTFTMTVKNTQENATEWYSTRDKVNAHLKKYPIELVLPRTNATQLTPILTNITKKIELPYFGPGTTYSLEKDNDWYGRTEEYGSGHIEKLVANIRVSAEMKYDFKLEYKIIDGRDILVKSTKRMVVRPDKPAYIMQVRGDSNLSYDTSSNTETIQLLGKRLPNGAYEYYIKQNLNGKETIINTFKLPYMLTFCTISGAGTRPESSFESPPQQSILYWDPVSKSYKVEMRSMYYYADTAYGDIDFAAYTYSSYSIGEGAWEFLTEGKPNYNFSASQSPDAWSNYIARSFQYAYNTDHEIGTVFPILSKSSFPSTHDNVMGIYTTAADFEALDAYLKNNPFHLITMPYWRYTNGWKDVPRRDTGITKPVPIEITDAAASKGATYSISNDGLSARFKMAVPVTYLDVDLPTPDYTLPSPLDCNGSNKYINTNLKLFDTAKDFTILLDYQHYCPDGTYLADNRVILHCRYESTNTSYRRCGLAVETGTAPQAHVRGATDYLTNGDILGTTNYILDGQKKDMDLNLNINLNRYRIVIVYKAGLPHRIIQVDENNILYDYPLYKNIPAFRAHTRPLYLGCQNSTSNSRTKYFAGRINECKVWNGVALDDDQILRAIGDGPYPEPNYTISNCVCSSNNRVNTGMKIFDIYKDSTIAIKFTNKSTSTGALGEVLSVGCGDDNAVALRILYTKDEKSYRVQHSGGKLADYTNILANDATLPADANGDICIFIVYKMGRPAAIVDYSTGEAVYLPLNDVKNFTNVYTKSKYAVTLGYRQQTATDSANSRTSSVWDGTIHNCMIWNGRALNEAQIDNVYKRLLK